MKKESQTYYEIVLVAMVGIASGVIRLLALRQTIYANGWDGYYYLVQLKALVEEGAMHSPDVSLIYPFLVLLYKLTNNYLFAFKLAAALLAGVNAMTLYYLAKQLLRVHVKEGDEPQKKHSYLVPLVVVLFSVYSPSLTFLTAQFPKNLLGFIALQLFLISVLHLLETAQAAKARFYQSLAWLMAAFVLTLFTHRMATALSVLVLGVVLFWYIVKQKKYLLLYAGGGLALLGVTASLIFPGVLSIQDFKRFEGLFTAVPQIAPLSFLRLLGVEKISPFWIAELGFLYLQLLFFLGFILYRSFFQKGKGRDLSRYTYYIALSLLSLAMVFPFFTFDLMGMAYRFLFCFVLLTPLLMLPLLRKASVSLLISLTIGLTMLSCFSWRSYAPAAFDPPYAYYETLTRKAAQLLKTTPHELVVAHKALAEIYTFETGQDALPWQPETRYQYAAVWRIAAGISNEEYGRYLADTATATILRIQGRYCLIREDRWQQFVKKVKEAGDRELLQKIYSWKNPCQMRPSFITKGRNAG